MCLVALYAIIEPGYYVIQMCNTNFLSLALRNKGLFLFHHIDESDSMHIKNLNKSHAISNVN